MNHQLDARTGIREALPTVFGYIGIGIAFGIVGQATGFSPLIVSAMSFFIFAGSAQFVTVSMLTGGKFGNITSYLVDYFRPVSLEFFQKHIE